MNRKGHIGQWSAPEATIHVYRWDAVMAAPEQSFIGDTTHIGGEEYFDVICGCTIFDVILWANHEGGGKSSVIIA